MTTAGAILIGNELLSAKIADRNLFVLAKKLGELGIEFCRASMIRDDIDEIAEEVASFARRFDWVFTSGGVGPTHDDVTVDAVAKAFGQEVIEHPDLAGMIRGFYGERLRPGHLRMARVPERARMIRTEAIPWPALLCENVWLLPGVPEIFELKMNLLTTVIEARAVLFSLAALCSLDEGTLKPALDEAVEAFPDVSIGSYPQYHPTSRAKSGDGQAAPTDAAPVVRTKLTFDGPDRARCEGARRHFVERLPAESVLELEG